MEKLKVNLFDKSFFNGGPSAGTGSTKIPPEKVEWGVDIESPISVYTDMCLNFPKSKSKYNIAWIIESRAIMPKLYENLQIYDEFDFVITHDKQLLDLNEKFVFTPLGGHWIYDDDCKVHNKTKNLSIIASNKKYAPGHILRHQVINKYRNKIDSLYGSGYCPIQNKIAGLKDYRFHIVIENIKTDYWFTEKLIDAFLTGCIPIYYGTPSIGDFFNKDGMICFDNIDELDKIIDNYVNEEYYQMHLQSIYDNFMRAQQFLTPEDYMYEKLLRKLI
jgi:hypothetical protein